jgi:Ca2+-binding EF-hand superfamily protein
MTTLSPKYIQEITSSFHIFDETKTGYISPNCLKLLLRSFGIRVSRTTVYSHILEEKKRLNILENRNFNKNYDHDDVDLQMCISIIERHYPREDRELVLESKLNFKLFAGSKGYIALEDIKRIVNEINEGFNDNDNHTQLQKLDIDPELMKEMIEEFDCNCDGVISYEEFDKIMNYNK